MAKNIVIAEGGTAKNFTAKKLQTNLQGSGRVNWIPEDEAVDYVNLKDHIFREAGTFNPSDFNCDGFKQVKIDIPADVKPKTITKNGEFYAADDGCLGYSKVTVAVPGGGGGGPYTVRFFDDDRQTILKTDANVPYGGSASCTVLDGTIKNGLYFKGWNPSPTNVKNDMNCYPIRGDYIIDEGEIQDSWETICAVNGAGYPLGSYKALVLNIPQFTNIPYVLVDNQGGYSGDTLTYINGVNIALHMIKVAEDEDGSTSTWISTGVIPFGNTSNVMSHNNSGGNPTYGNWSFSVLHQETYGSNGTADWMTSIIRRYLNEYFITALPQCLQDTIKQVNKTYKGLNVYQSHGGFVEPTFIDKTSIDKIWVPSVAELYNKISAYTVENYSGGISSLCEVSGIDYSSIYVPTYGNDTYLLRSAGRSVGGNNYISYAQINEGTSKITGKTNIGATVNRFPFGFCL